MTFHPDNPIDPDKLEKGTLANIDAFGFAPIAEKIADYLKSQQNNSTSIGILGKWGSGKSTLMRMIQRQYQGEYRKTVWFNAWRYDHEPNPVVPLLNTIANSIPREKETKVLRDRLIKLGYAIANSTRMRLGLANTSFVELSGKDFIGAYNGNSFPSEDHFNKLHDYGYFDIENVLDCYKYSAKIFNPPIVVFIDDIDRCVPERALKLLDSTKSLFDMPGFAFVMGVAPQSIPSWIKSRYGNDSEIDPDSYLNKIFNISMQVPDKKQGLKSFIDSVAEKVFGDKIKELTKESISKVSDFEPRHIIQCINILKSVYLKTTGKIDFNDTITAVIIKVRWPSFYRFILEDPFTNTKILQHHLKNTIDQSADNPRNVERLKQYFLANGGLKSFINNSEIGAFFFHYDCPDIFNIVN